MSMTKMITVSVNDEEKKIADQTCLSEALIAWGYAEGLFAVAINKTFVPRSQYEKTLLAAHYLIDIVAPIQGG